MSSLAPKSIGGWSEIFNKPDADVTFKSSDNVLFALHKKNLATHTDGFPRADSNVSNEVIELSEESQTLELLFRFIYPPDVPDLADLPFKLLMELAQAAEKYIVHIAMPLCRVHVLYVVRDYHKLANLKIIADTKKDDLKLIVKYATEHSYMNILDDTAPLLILEPLEVSIFWFPVEKQIFWALYRDQWLLVHRDACSSLSSHRTKGYCRFCNDSNVNLRATLYLQHLLTFNDFTRTQLPVHYCMQLPEWQKEVQERIEKIRKFSSICDQPAGTV